LSATTHYVIGRAVSSPPHLTVWHFAELALTFLLLCALGPPITSFDRGSASLTVVGAWEREMRASGAERTRLPWPVRKFLPGHGIFQPKILSGVAGVTP